MLGVVAGMGKGGKARSTGHVARGVVGWTPCPGPRASIPSPSDRFDVSARYGHTLRMARTTIKATYSLDPETVRKLEQMARRWGVSKSEALARAIRSVAAQPAPRPEAVAALDELQGALALTERTAVAWAREVRRERRASPPAR